VRSSLFWRVTRYPAGSSVDPRENRLTEVTAAALEQVDGLAHAFARSLIETSVESAAHSLPAIPDALATLLQPGALERLTRVEVRTQLPTSKGRFVDMALLLRPPLGKDEVGLLAWVEVKHGSDLHSDQLDAYVDAIKVERNFPEPVAPVVVLLGPRGWKPTGTVPATVLQADWQAAGRAATAIAPRVVKPEQAWLLREYIRYLKEEGLADPDGLNTTTALALMEVGNAHAALAGVCEHAQAEVERGWGASREQDKFIPLFWATHETHRVGETPNPAWGDCDFEWLSCDTSNWQYFDEPRGGRAFIASVSIARLRDNLTKHPDNQEWLARRFADGFAYFWASGAYRLARVLYPDALLDETKLEDQGRRLGKWVVAAFDALLADPPPTLV
jgi:hypothetical protein